MSTITVPTLTRKIIQILRIRLIWSPGKYPKITRYKQTQTIPKIGRPTTSHVEHVYTIEYIGNNSQSETFLVTIFPLLNVFFFM